MRHTTLIGITSLVALLAPRAAHAQPPQEDAVTLWVGLNQSILTRPEDEPGDITLLAGSAFLGTGLALGLTYETTQLLPPVTLETGIFYTRSNLSGLAALGEQQREALLEADLLRLPLWARYKHPLTDSLRLTAGLGPELLLGLTSASVLRERNVATEDQGTLPTTSVTTLYLTLLMGIELDIGPVVLPFSLHASLNPLTGATTQERLDNHQSPDAPGQLRMEFDYEILFLTGISYEL